MKGKNILKFFCLLALVFCFLIPTTSFAPPPGETEENPKKKDPLKNDSKQKGDQKDKDKDENTSVLFSDDAKYKNFEEQEDSEICDRSRLES